LQQEHFNIANNMVEADSSTLFEDIEEAILARAQTTGLWETLQDAKKRTYEKAFKDFNERNKFSVRKSTARSRLWQKMGKGMRSTSFQSPQSTQLHIYPSS
jgi:3-methyladenine DNA glycosylase Tag